MDTDKTRTLTLEITAGAPYMYAVTRFVESAANTFGLPNDEYPGLCSATEKIFLYLANFICPGKPLEVQCFNGFYYTRVLFRFSAEELNLSGLNIVSTITPDRERNPETTGLLIASRFVDYLDVSIEKNNRICLAITKEKTYPAQSEKLDLPTSAGKIFTEIPDAEQLKYFAGLTSLVYDAAHRPGFFSCPGKLVDMIASGEYSAVIALNAKKEIVGGVLLCLRAERNVQCFGPYCFCKEQETMICEMLLEACLNKIARTKALGLLSISGLPEALRNSFEKLGSLHYHEEGKAPVEEFSFYLLLHDEPGLAVWSCSDVTYYLTNAYRRLGLVREIKSLRDMVETRSGYSLFSAEINRERRAVTLRPLSPGNDYAANLGRHIRFLRNEGFPNLYFALDPGILWQAEMIPILLNYQFEPGIILPFAGKSDIVIFEYVDKAWF